MARGSASIIARCLAVAAFVTGRAHAQQPPIVPTVADSPTAAELLGRAREQAAANPGESARLAAELLRDLANRLVETERPGVYQGVADQVNALLATHPEVLERYQAEVGTQAREWLAQGRALEVATRFATTDAGLEAMLLLAGRALQQARADEASAWLRRAAMHPTAGVDPAPRLALEAMAAWAAGDAGAWSAASDQLAARPGVQAGLVELVRAMGAPAARDAVRDRSEVSPDVDAELPTVPWVEAWSMPLAWSPASIRNRGIVPREDMFGREELPAPRMPIHTMVPIISGGDVIVADGRTVACLDLLTHTPRWQAILAIDEAARSADTMLTPCIVGTDQVFTVVSTGDLGGAVSSRVVAVHRDDGTVAWQRPLDDVQPGMPGGLRSAGPAALVGDVLAVPCQRQVGRLELACWLVGLDASSGATRWTVPLGAANGLLEEFGTTMIVRGGIGAVAHGGCAVVGSAVGTAACIEASTGAVRWIAREDLSRSRGASIQQCWEAVVPVVDGSSAWFLHADGRMVTQRALSDGSEIAQLAIGPGEPLGPAEYLVGDGGVVIGVAASGAMSAVAAADPSRQLWQQPGTPLDPPVGRAVLARAGTQRVILLPRANRIDLHDLATGARIGSSTVTRGGNVGVGTDRVAVASEMSLEVWGRGDRILADLVALVDRDASSDADIALAESALEQGELDRALDMARRAMRRVAASPGSDESGATAARIFDVLIALVRTAPRSSDAVEALRSAAVLPGQRMRVALALADRDALRGEWADAARTLAAAMPDLADDALVDHAGALVRSSQILSLAMQQLVIRSRAAGSNEVERAAEASRAAAGDRVEAFARAWRGTEASIAALIDASELASTQSRDDDANRCAQRAALVGLERLDAGLTVPVALVDRLVPQLVGVGPGDELTVSTLRRLHRAVPSAAAFERLAAGSPWVLAPALASAGGEVRKGRRAIQFAASMPALLPFAERQKVPGLGLLALGQQLVGVKGATLAPAWTIDVEEPAPTIVRLQPTTVVLEQTLALPGRLRGLDPANGRVAWSIEDLGAVFGPIQAIRDRRDDEELLSRRGRFGVLPSAEGTVAVRGDGTCAKIDHDGRVRWVSPRSLPMVEQAASACGAVALVGSSQSADVAVTIVSTASGRERGSVLVEGLSSSDAVHATLCGFLVTRGLSSAMIEDTEAGPRVLWERAGPPGATRRTASVVLHEAIFLGQPADGSYRLDLDDGSSTPLAWDEGSGGAWTPLLEVDQGLLFGRGDRVMLAKASGAIIGSARLAPSSTVVSAVACREGVIVQALEMPELPAFQGGSCFTLLDPAQGLRQVQEVARVNVPVGWRSTLLLEGWLLKFGDEQCLAVPVGPG